MKFKQLVTGILLLSLTVVASATTADFNEGVRAYQRADYAKALTIWKAQAEQGNMVAQMLVGSMYAYGEGTPRDDREAVKWFTLSAKSGYARAQFNLGVMYENGWGVEKDLNAALYWFRQAAAQGREDARKKLAKYEKPASTPAEPNESVAKTKTEPDSTQVTDNEHVDMANKEAESKPVTDTAEKPAQQETVQQTPARPMQVKQKPPHVATVDTHKKERIALLLDTTPAGQQVKKPAAGKNHAVTATRQLPPDTGWLGRQNPDFYTIQLASNQNRMVIEDFIENNHINNDYQIIVTSYNNKTSYALVYGAYSDINVAQDAIRRLPGAWRQYVPWIREIRSLLQE